MIHYQLDEHGIATLTWDMPGRNQNVMNGESMTALYAMIRQVTQDAAVKGILMTSAKPDFFAGGDLAWLLAAQEAAPLHAFITELHRHLRQLETSGKPVAMALPGTALGGGLEIALAGHYRVAADNPKARFGLPEVSLGLLPGGGGTQRLPRLIGIQKALPLLLEGKKLKAKQALDLGILNAIVPAGTHIQAAHDWLCAQTQPVQQPWDVKGYKIPGGNIQSPVIQQTLMVANAMLHNKTLGNYPAPKNILSCVYEGLITDFDTGLAIETRYFVHCVLSSEAKNMIRNLFFNLGEANKLAARPAAIPQQTYTKIGILGAGMMGAGIAYVTAKAGLQVVLLDTSQEAAERGKSYAKALVERAVARGQSSPEQAQALLARIIPTTQYTDLVGAECVIEAVFEDRTIKADVIRQAEAVLSSAAFIASNTSTLPITGLAEHSVRPTQFIGLHFFSPVDKMPIVEIILGKQTNEVTLAHALDYVKAIGMTPIVVHDSRGFYTSRCFATYVFEGVQMLSEGIHPAVIEQAGLQAGMPVGPLALIDEVTAELLVKIDRQTQADLGTAYHAPPGITVLQRMVALGRIGKKAKQGFYDYPEGGKKSLWSGLNTLCPVRSNQPALPELKRRLLHIQALETVRCLEEGVITTLRDADLGSILAWGFPVFRGGTIGHIQTTGVGVFVRECDDLAAQHGERFQPTERLRVMAEQNKSFYF